MTIFREPEWNSLLAQSDADEAMQELQDRLDREAAYGPALICPPSPSGAQHRPRCNVADPSPSTHNPVGGTPSPTRPRPLATGDAAGNGARLEGPAGGVSARGA